MIRHISPFLNFAQKDIQYHYSFYIEKMSFSYNFFTSDPLASFSRKQPLFYSQIQEVFI